MTPYKRAEFATFASAGNSRKVPLLCQLKVTSSEEVQSIRDVCNFVKLSQFNIRWKCDLMCVFSLVCIVCAFVAFHVLTTVRFYRRDGTINIVYLFVPLVRITDGFSLVCGTL